MATNPDHISLISPDNALYALECVEDYLLSLSDRETGPLSASSPRTATPSTPATAVVRAYTALRTRAVPALTRVLHLVTASPPTLPTLKRLSHVLTHRPTAHLSLLTLASALPWDPTARLELDTSLGLALRIGAPRDAPALLALLLLRVSPDVPLAQPIPLMATDRHHRRKSDPTVAASTSAPGPPVPKGSLLGLIAVMPPSRVREAALLEAMAAVAAVRPLWIAKVIRYALQRRRHLQRRRNGPGLGKMGLGVDKKQQEGPSVDMALEWIADLFPPLHDDLETLEATPETEPRGERTGPDASSEDPAGRKGNDSIPAPHSVPAPHLAYQKDDTQQDNEDNKDRESLLLPSTAMESQGIPSVKPKDDHPLPTVLMHTVLGLPRPEGWPAHRRDVRTTTHFVEGVVVVLQGAYGGYEGHHRGDDHVRHHGAIDVKEVDQIWVDVLRSMIPLWSTVTEILTRMITRLRHTHEDKDMDPDPDPDQDMPEDIDRRHQTRNLYRRLVHAVMYLGDLARGDPPVSPSISHPHRALSTWTGVDGDRFPWPRDVVEEALGCPAATLAFHLAREWRGGGDHAPLATKPESTAVNTASKVPLSTTVDLRPSPRPRAHTSAAAMARSTWVRAKETKEGSWRPDSLRRRAPVGPSDQVGRTSREPRASLTSRRDTRGAGLFESLLGLNVKVARSTRTSSKRPGEGEGGVVGREETRFASPYPNPQLTTTNQIRKDGLPCGEDDCRMDDDVAEEEYRHGPGACEWEDKEEMVGGYAGAGADADTDTESESDRKRTLRGATETGPIRRVYLDSDMDSDTDTCRRTREEDDIQAFVAA